MLSISGRLHKRAAMNFMRGDAYVEEIEDSIIFGCFTGFGNFFKPVVPGGKGGAGISRVTGVS